MKENLFNIEDLVQDDHNFNKGTKDGQRLMKKSFESFGAGRSVLIDQDNRIIAGNKSTLAAIDAGIKKVRIIETTGDELIAVKRTDISLDSKEGRELALADNATQQVNLSWDPENLKEMQQSYGIDVDDWGIDMPQLAQEEDHEIAEDNYDPDSAPKQQRVKPGELWQLGEHRLICGDSTKKDDVQRLMGGEQADLWLTDPPYNVAVKNSDGLTIANDNMESSKFLEFLTAAFQAASSVLKDGCPFYVWFASSERKNFDEALARSGLAIRQELIWNKNHFTLGRSHYQYKHEPCLYGWKGKVCRYFIDARNRATVISDEEEINIDKMKLKELRTLLHDIMAGNVPTTVFNEPKPLKDDDHPTMKPIRLFAHQIINSSRPDEVVLDTFGGSGTTIIACEQLSRKARLVELDPKYCDVIIDRWEKFTGQKAEKINE